MEPLTTALLAKITKDGWGPRAISYSFYSDGSLPEYWTNESLNAVFGSDRGDVTEISTDQRSAFSAAVSLWDSVADGRGYELSAEIVQELPLAAGMEFSAEIRQGKRTVLEYLLSPVQRVVSEAAMER